MRGLEDRFFVGVLLPVREWLGSPATSGAVLLVAVAALAGWWWLLVRQRRTEADSRSTREILGAALERERARGELVLGREDTLAVLRDLRRLASGLRRSDATGLGDDAGRRGSN